MFLFVISFLFLRFRQHIRVTDALDSYMVFSALYVADINFFCAEILAVASVRWSRCIQTHLHSILVNFEIIYSLFIDKFLEYNPKFHRINSGKRIAVLFRKVSIFSNTEIWKLEWWRDLNPSSLRDLLCVRSGNILFFSHLNLSFTPFLHLFIHFSQETFNWCV